MLLADKIVTLRKRAGWSQEELAAQLGTVKGKKTYGYLPKRLKGLVDEIVDLPMMRNYIVAFTDSCYQNPESICPFHQMLLPRTIKDYDEGHR